MFVPFESKKGHCRCLEIKNITVEDLPGLRGILKGNSYIIELPKKGIIININNRVKINYNGPMSKIPQSIITLWNNISGRLYYTSDRYTMELIPEIVTKPKDICNIIFG